MSIFAIADLHLSFTADKPMSIYGQSWQNHEEQIKANWTELVGPEDTVLIPGDISWGLKSEEATEDLAWVAALPGQKVLLKGNHDLWWNSIGKLNKMYPDMFFLQNTFYKTEGWHICGSRGWICPEDPDFTQHDDKIYRRELIRLRMSLDAAVKDGAEHIIGMMHFPPTCGGAKESGFTEIFTEYGVEHVVYGHLHGTEGQMKCLKGLQKGVNYRLTACDYVGCRPVKIV